MPVAKSKSLSVALVPEKDLKDFSASNNILATIFYGEGDSTSLAQGYLQVAVSLPQLGKESRAEVWTSDLPHEANQYENIYYTANSEMVFGSISFQEIKTSSLEKLTLRAYKEIFEFLVQKQFPFLVRCWNYFPNINQETNGIERYKLFCAGRHNAFSEKYKQMEKYLPAASAVGSKSGPLTINFIAARNHGGEHIENPRQVSAYQYPTTYGKRSPSFARATYMNWGSSKHLYLAGTASIVGYESRHFDNPLMQTQEIRENLDSLIFNCTSTLNSGTEEVKIENASIIKTYIRDVSSFPIIKDILEEKMAGAQSHLYLVGDICREELLLEVEGVLSVNS